MLETQLFVASEPNTTFVPVFWNAGKQRLRVRVVVYGNDVRARTELPVVLRTEIVLKPNAEWRARPGQRIFKFNKDVGAIGVELQPVKVCGLQPVSNTEPMRSVIGYAPLDMIQAGDIELPEVDFGTRN